MRSVKTTVVERVTGEIRREIERKRLDPGDVIATEGDLAKQFQVSRNAVREAVGRLRGLGLVDSRQSKGVVVLRSDPAQVLRMVLPQYAVDGASLAELGELRYAIEMGAAEIAVQRATKEDIARLRELGEEFREVVFRDQEAADRVDEEFHGALLAATHNRLLSDMHVVVAGFFRRASREVEGWYRKEVTVEWEHIAIGQAIEERDGDRVRGILRGHLKRSLAGKRREDLTQSRERRQGEKRMSQAREKIDYRPVQTRHTREMEEAVIRVMREASSYTMGEEVKAFEKEFAEFMGANAAVGLSNCTSALELSAVLSGVTPGDEVIVPGHTFVASAVPFARRGAKIAWADIDPEARVMSAETVAPLVTKRTKVIVAVHLLGLTVDMDPILTLARERGIRVVEDCAQAPGARYKGKRVGTLGDYGCFSFHTQKNITTLGEGGMLLCRREEDAGIAKKLRWMGNEPFAGERKRYWEPAMANVVQCGIQGEWPYNFCLAEATAAVGRLELRRLDVINANRQAQAKKLMEGLAEVRELSFQKVGAGCEHVYHMMGVKYDGSKTGKTRSDLIALLYEEHDIKCYVHYMPLYRFDLFRKMGCAEARCPVSDEYYDSMYGYPWWTEMAGEILDRYIRATREVCARLRKK